MDRQFSEDEAREVFARAAERQHEVRSKGEGLSLDELRAIGREAGLDPEHIEAAARAVATGEPETGRTGLGPLPSGVFRTVVLPSGITSSRTRAGRSPPRARSPTPGASASGATATSA